MAAYTTGEIAVALPEARRCAACSPQPTISRSWACARRRAVVFEEADDRTDAPVAVIAHSTWIREFDGDPRPSAVRIRVADQFVQLVGVAPERFIGIDRIRPGGRGPDLWLPIWLARPGAAADDREQRRQARTSPSSDAARRVPIPQLRAEADVIARRLAAARGDRGTARAEVVACGGCGPRAGSSAC